MNFTVVGAGAWGTAMAVHLSGLGHVVSLAPRRAEHAAALNGAHQNADYLPGVRLPAELYVTDDLPMALSGVDVVLLACPSHALRETTARLRTAMDAVGGKPRLIVCLAKGLELETFLRPSQVMSEMWGAVPAGVLTGPTNAAEFARGLPAAMVLAAAGPSARWADLQAALSSGGLRVYGSDDIAGAEFGGALKNIYAIAAGCCDGLHLGDNAKAALLTRALAEMVRVGTRLGARAETFYGLSGFGDLDATCHGVWSRNRQFGEQIGRGAVVADLIRGRKTVVEGYRTTDSFAGLCAKRRIDAPILSEVHAILYAGKRPADAVAALMSRELKAESRL
jgi:glycerol-3-phosphate dehydrogenase (NAD(P)+)